jgi:hypothetical protein
MEKPTGIIHKTNKLSQSHRQLFVFMAQP